MYFWKRNLIGMKIVVASDSYKGCLTSKEVAHYISCALGKLLPDAQIVQLNVSDGGEGTLMVLSEIMQGEILYDMASDPLGRPIRAGYMVSDTLAVIESASVCGLTLLSKDERNPLITSSRGLGELIVRAVERGCKKFIIGLGGSATNDGGEGMLSAPGFLEAVRGKEFIVACDVDTPFLGENGATRVFARQKGATPEQVEILENRMQKIAAKILLRTGVDVAMMPGAGAAGGLGGAFFAYLNATLSSGADLVLDAIDFQKHILDADLVITGEGCSDFQTLKGKLPFGILRRSQNIGVPVALLSGEIKDKKMLIDAGFAYIERVSSKEVPLCISMKSEVAKENIERATETLIRKMRGKV